MKHLVRTEVAVLSLILIALCFSFKPLAMPMHEMAEMAVGGTLFIFIGLLAGLFIYERAGDEREVVHRAIADRAGFLAGAGVLSVIIAVQSFMHRVDSWLVAVLGVMVIAKLLGLWYVHIKK